MSLAGKTALITGGGSGIGRAIALQFAQAGCKVAIAGRNADKLQEVVRASGVNMLTHTVDVANSKSVDTLIAWAERELGQIDILVNAAGINTKRRMMADMPSETCDEVMAINASGPYYAIAAALPGMRKRNAGLIINICSIAGKRASMLGGVAYSASKFAMQALGMAVGLEEGKHGIRVTNIHPGEVDTPILEQRPSPVTEEHRGRILQPEDIAELTLAIALLPARAHVPELIIKPVTQDYA
jgi:NAD(P)-dependent dehydrogenase (short-subunit alcohol dehydrogenase family)